MNLPRALRMAGLAHAAAMAVIHADSFPPGERWDEAAFATQLALPGVFALVDEAGGMVLARIAADEAEILTLAVVPALRRRGRARALLAQAIAHAGACGARSMFLEVAADNDAAQALYAAAGFHEVGRRRGYYSSGQAAIVLQADISPS